MAELKCTTCSPRTGRVVQITDVNPFPEFSSATNTETFELRITSTCTSSLRHLHYEYVVLVFKFGTLEIRSDPVQLLSRRAHRKERKRAHCEEPTQAELPPFWVGGSGGGERLWAAPLRANAVFLRGRPVPVNVTIWKLPCKYTLPLACANIVYSITHKLLPGLVQYSSTLLFPLCTRRALDKARYRLDIYPPDTDYKQPDDTETDEEYYYACAVTTFDSAESARFTYHREFPKTYSSNSITDPTNATGRCEIVCRLSACE
eukprot:TRINITY_DN1148_c0_g1_i3.p1 TRINITY_DN1148_c0_g1~~TRINITY_DN1148_c0_g1_i3.p1  ORF type:complete len:261 (+),score=26.79 TRINITY_DN1148_c0_g1_i3:773-1555(+)